MRVREPQWARFTKAAVGEMTQVSTKPLRLRLLTRVEDVRRRMAEAHAAQADSAVPRRADVRLLPAVLGTCAAAAVARTLPLEWIMTSALILAAGLLGTVLLGASARGKAGARSVGPVPGRGSPVRGLLRAGGPTLVLTGLCMFAVLGSVVLQLWSAAASPLQQALARGGDFVLTLQVRSPPRLLDSANGAQKVIFTAQVESVRGNGQVLTGRATVQVLAALPWAELSQGDTAVTAATVRGSNDMNGAGQASGAPVSGGGAGAEFLRPSTVPQHVVAAGGAQSVVTAVRSSWVGAVGTVWDARSGDTAGLLPGMVMGDRGGMDSALEEAMKTVGLTHLTAVSGANCTLVLASLMLGLRSMRMPPSLAFAVAGVGLIAFVLVVGPDPSVLRAAVMGSIGAMAVMGGRPKQVGALLSVTVVVLLVADPWLIADYAFILSVLATLGLHLIGQRCVRWIDAVAPLWLAQAIAIPLAAQLFCAPVIVLLQARFTPYTIPANMLAAPVVALVTTVGTCGLAIAAVFPPVAVLCAAVSGAGAWWVALVARTMSALPGASLPWPEGGEGLVLMSILNATVLAAFFAVVERERAARIVARLRSLLPLQLRRHGFGALVIFAMAATAWWSAAVLQP